MASTTLYDDPWTSRWTYHALGMGDRTFHWVRSNGDRAPGCKTFHGVGVRGAAFRRPYQGVGPGAPWKEPRGPVFTLTELFTLDYLGKYPMCPHCLFLVLTVGGVPGFPAVDHAHFWV